MWIHLNLILIGMLTIFVPCMYFTSPNAPIIFSTFLFFSGIYLTSLYVVMLFLKDSKEKLEKENKKLQKELNNLTKEKEESTQQI